MVVGAGAGLPHPGRVHLSPNFSSVPRHGSLPNVNAGVTCQVSRRVLTSVHFICPQRIASNVSVLLNNYLVTLRRC